MGEGEGATLGGMQEEITSARRYSSNEENYINIAPFSNNICHKLHVYNRAVRYMSAAYKEIIFEYLCARQTQNFSGQNKASVLMNHTEEDS